MSGNTYYTILGTGSYQHAESSARRRSAQNDTNASAQGPRVLVLPFGKGSLSVFMLATLRRLMETIAIEEDLESIPLPCDHFDLICGAGLGGLFAIIFGRLRMSVDEVLDWVYSDVRRVYWRPPKNYPSLYILKGQQDGIPRWRQSLGGNSSYERLWKGCILDLLAKHEMDDELFYSAAGCKTCVFTSSISTAPHGGHEWSVNRFRSYGIVHHRNSNASIREVAWATVMDKSDKDEQTLGAAMISIDNRQNFAAKRKFCDPDREAYDEMKQIWKGLEDSCYVEIRPFRQEMRSFDETLEWLFKKRDFIGQMLEDDSAIFKRLPKMDLGSSSSSTIHIWDFPNRLQSKPEDFSDFERLRQLWGTTSNAKPCMHSINGGNDSFAACARRLSRRSAPASDPPSKVGDSVQSSEERPSHSRACHNTEASLFNIKYHATESEPGAEQFFWKLRDGALAYLGELKPDEEKIHVAILDTGINTSKYPELKEACIGEVKPFGEFQNGDDEDGHGSLVAALVNRVNPHVELAIAKVFRNNDDLKDENSIARVIAALKWAIFNKRVHIIVMSFGFPKEPTDGEFRHLLVAEASRKGSLLFAASGNYGVNCGIPFPANVWENVFGINSADAYGSPVNYTTEKNPFGYDFTALGEGIRGLKGPSEDEQPPTVSGSSVATPIAAGIASIFLELAGKRGIKMKYGSKLRTYRGMARMLLRSSREKFGFHNLLPNMLFNDDGGNHKDLAAWISFELSRI